MAVLAPMPKASVSTATAVKPGLLHSVRTANRRSWKIALIMSGRAILSPFFTGARMVGRTFYGIRTSVGEGTPDRVVPAFGYPVGLSAFGIWVSGTEIDAPATGRPFGVQGERRDPLP